MEEFKSTLFRTEGERNLWIKLNAERQIDWEKNLTYFDQVTKSHKPTQQALNPRSMERAMEISTEQLETDEEKGKLRYTLEELLTLDRKELDAIDIKRHQDFWNKIVDEA